MDKHPTKAVIVIIISTEVGDAPTNKPLSCHATVYVVGLANL